MTLGFKKTFPWGEPTYFKEKILAGAGYGPIVSPPKIHTIREGNRWGPGMIIHMAYGVRTKKYEQFNKGIEGLSVCKSVQSINISWKSNPFIHVYVDGKELSPPIINLLWSNDGFDSYNQFHRWFSKDFEGQIIHFTDFRY
jgi:hypothetical protein